MRPIDADWLLDVVENIIKWDTERDRNRIIHQVRELTPTIEPERKKGKWIPCRECLPEKSGKYLVTVQNGNVYAGTYDKYSGRFQCAATAWMELPAPYQEDD